MNLLGRALFGDTSCHGEIEDGRFHVVTGDLYGTYQRNGQSFAMDDITLGAPIANVRFLNVMGGFNEPGTTRSADRKPMWLPKATNYVTGDGGEIQSPSMLKESMVMESELAVVVGKPLRKASPAECHDAIFGWSIFDDLTAPEVAAGGWYFAVAKSMDGFSSWGPWIRRDLTEERVMEGLEIKGYINGTQSQEGNTKYFVFTPSEMISHMSFHISLSPGDVIALGTPPPPPEVVVGDHVVCEVEEIGVLNNYIVADSDQPPSVWPRSQAAATAAVR